MTGSTLGFRFPEGPVGRYFAALLVLVIVSNVPLAAQNIQARFTTGKSDYLIGEPVFIVLSLTNKADVPLWIDFGQANQFCDTFYIEIPGADSALEQWGCGFGGSCGHGLRQVPPGKSTSVRQLLNRQFNLRQPGAYAIQANTVVLVRSQNLFGSPIIEQFDVSDGLKIELKTGDEDQLRAAFQPIIEELTSADPITRAEAKGAITQTAPPFLEDILVRLGKTPDGFPALAALRKVGTTKALDALAEIATSGSFPLQVEAITNLGRAGDKRYLPFLLRLMNTHDVLIEGAAAQAAANLGGAAVIPQIVVLVSSPDVQTRQAGANALEYTHAREAVPVLIALLLDSKANIRQTAVSGLALLTHRVVSGGDRWADVTTRESALSVHQKWVSWWNANAADAKIHGMNDCAAPIPLN